MTDISQGTRGQLFHLSCDWWVGGCWLATQSERQDWEHVTNISQGTEGGHAQVKHLLCKLIPVMVGQTKDRTTGWMTELSCKNTQVPLQGQKRSSTFHIQIFKLAARGDQDKFQCCGWSLWQATWTSLRSSIHCFQSLSYSGPGNSKVEASPSNLFLKTCDTKLFLTYSVTIHT